MVTLMTNFHDQYRHHSVIVIIISFISTSVNIFMINIYASASVFGYGAWWYLTCPWKRVYIFWDTLYHSSDISINMCGIHLLPRKYSNVKYIYCRFCSNRCLFNTYRYIFNVLFGGLPHHQIVFWISVFLLNMIMFFNILITLRTGKKEIQKALSVLSVASSGICLTIFIEPWKFFGAFQKFHQQWGLFNQHVRLWTGLKELKKEVCWAIEQYFGPN